MSIMTPRTITPRGGNIMQCPACGWPCKTVKTNQMTSTYREITYLCTNHECLHMFVASLTPVRTIDPPSLSQEEDKER